MSVCGAVCEHQVTRIPPQTSAVCAVAVGIAHAFAEPAASLCHHERGGAPKPLLGNLGL